MREEYSSARVDHQCLPAQRAPSCQHERRLPPRNLQEDEMIGKPHLLAFALIASLTSFGCPDPNSTPTETSGSTGGVGLDAATADASPAPAAPDAMMSPGPEAGPTPPPVDAALAMVDAAPAPIDGAGPGPLDGGSAAPGAPVFTEFPVTTQQPGRIVAGKDGMYFTAGDAIGRIAMDGQITAFKIPPPLFGGTADIAPGPDGNIWVARIGRMDRLSPDGVFTSFPIPAGIADPCCLTTGPDQALWFASSSGDAIVRLTVTGVFTPFKLPAKTRPTDIVTGPDRALWFGINDFDTETLTAAGRIGRMTVGGEFSAYGFSASAGPNRLAVGSDMRIWVTSTGAAVAGAFSPTSINTPPGPSGGPSAFLWTFAPGMGGMATAEDGTLWFAIGSRVAIGRILPPRTGGLTASLTSLMYKEFSDGVTAPTRDIAAGPDRTLWYTTTTLKIGRIKY
jgi:virginiamycin B lyase